MKIRILKSQIELALALILGICVLMLYAGLLKTTVAHGQNNTREDAEKAGKPELVVQTGHTKSVHRIAFSPNGKILASGSADKSIKLWNAETGQEIKTFSGHNSGRILLGFSNDGKMLIFADINGTIELLDVETGQNTKSPNNPTNPITSDDKFLEFSPDRKILVRSGAANTIKLWNSETGKQIRTLAARSPVESAAFSADGKFLASGQYDRSIKLWNLETGQQINSFGDSFISTGERVSLAFSPDGKIVASGGDDRTVRLWNIENGKLIKTLGVDGRLPSMNVYSLAFSPDGNMLASGNEDGTVKLWELETGKGGKTLTGHTGNVVSFVFSPFGKILASGSNAGMIKLWNVETGKEIKQFAGHTGSISSILFSPDARMLGSVSDDEVVKLWSIETGKEIKLFDTDEDRIRSFGFSPDSRSLAGITSTGDLILWKLTPGQAIKSPVFATDEQVTSFAFSSDNKWLASSSRSAVVGSTDGIIKIWSVETRKEIKSFVLPSEDVDSLAFSSDNKTLASGSTEAIRLWSVVTGRQIQQFIGDTDSISSIEFSLDMKTLISKDVEGLTAFWNIETGLKINSQIEDIDSVSSPDGKLLASTANDGESINLWSADNGKEGKSLTGRTESFSSFAFSSDGKFFANGSTDDGTISLWSVETGKEIKRLAGHTKSVISLTFSPDGKMLVSGSIDDTIKFWDTETGKETNTFISKNQNVSELNFSPDGKILASAKWNLFSEEPTTLKLWNIKTGKEIRSITKSSNAVVFATVAFSPDSKILASGNNEDSLTLWNTDNGQVKKELPGTGGTFSATFSPNGKLLATRGIKRKGAGFEGSTEQSLKVWNVETGLEISTLSSRHISNFFDILIRSPLTFSPDDRMLASVNSNSEVELWDVETGKRLGLYTGHSSYILSLKFSPDAKTLMSASNDGTIKIWSIENNTLLATVTVLDKKDWIVVTPKGHFDTNKNLDNIQGMHWLLPDQPLTPKPLDIFMRQYYEPNLLQRVLKCNEENTCNTEFKPLPSIADINRVQPKVTINPIKTVAKTDGLVDVTVEIESVTEDVSNSAKDKTKRIPNTSGAYDLRLFRDGQLVGVSTPRDNLESFIKIAPELIEKNKQYFKETGKLTNTPEDQKWRELNNLTNVVTFKDNKAIYTFKDIKLPRNGNKKLEFSAYAFNADRVKSNTSHQSLEVNTIPLKEKPKAYLISIGVNKSAMENWKLDYAVKDAEITNQTLKARLFKQYNVVPIELVSDFDSADKSAPNNATKANIKTVIELLAGEKASADNLKRLTDALGKNIIDKLVESTPDDAVIITFSSHGYADNTGNFYLLPSDIKSSNEEKKLPDFDSMISSDELSLWLREVDAAEMVMIVDACHAARSVEGTDFKPGPMGSRGLGQLAYDKRMRILTATQSKDAAIEVGGPVGQGLLTYALIKNGLEEKMADFKPTADGKISLTEWLEFGVNRVPILYEKLKSGELKGKGFSDKDEDGKLKEQRQLPSLFDFRRDKSDDILLWQK